MKNLFVFAAVISLFLTSCGSIEEEITIAKNGSGEYTLKTDMMPSMVNMTVKFAKAFAKDSTVINEDSLTQAITAKMWSKFGGKVDSVIDYSDRIPDSLKDDPQTKKIMKNMQGFMRGTEKEGPLYMGMTYSFKEQSEFNEFMDYLSKRNAESGKSPAMSMFNSKNSKSSIQFDGKTLKRTTVFIESETEEEQKEDDNSLNELFAGATYKTTVTLPKKIVSAKGEGLVSYNGKVAIFEYPFMKLLSGEQNTDFEITMK